MAEGQELDMNAWLREQRTVMSAEWAARLFGEHATTPDSEDEAEEPTP